MIRIANENLQTLSGAARSVGVHPATVYRWAQRGRKGIRLEVLYMGGRLVTSAEALQRFFEAVTEAHRSTVSAPDSISTERVQESLKRAGF